MSRPEGLVCDSARSFEPLADAEKKASISVLNLDTCATDWLLWRFAHQSVHILVLQLSICLSLPNSYIVLYYIIPYLVYRMLILHLARCWAWPSLPDPRSYWRGSNLISWELVQNSDGQPFGIIYIILSYLFFLGASSKKIFVNFSLR